MKTLAIATTSAALLVSIQYLCWTQSSPSQHAGDDSAVRDRGREVFTAKCGKCHNADAAKELSDGSTLLTRLAASKDPKALLATRLKSMTTQDGNSVAAYVEELTAQFRASQK